VPQPTEPLRFGIMCRSTSFPAWQAAVIESLIDEDLAEPVLLIIDGRPGSRPAGYRDKAKRLFEGGTWLWNAFNKLYVERRSAASRPVDLTDRLSEASRLIVEPERRGRFSEYFDEHVPAIKSYDLDFILRFGFGIIRGDILGAARLGVWSYHHGDERAYRGRPPAFWELRNGERVVGAILQRLTDELDAGIVLRRGFFGVVPHSYVRTRDRVLFGSADFVAATCRSALHREPDWDRSSTTAEIRTAPTNATMAGFFAQTARAFVTTQVRGIGRADKWTVGVAEGDAGSILGGEPLQVDWLPELDGARYLADPFPFESGGRLGLLAEEFDYRTARGVVSRIWIDDPVPSPVIEPGVHASYPYVFEADGEVFCLPETYQARRVQLYRAEALPDRWTPVAVLLDDFAAVDPTLLLHDGRYWLFCTDHETGADMKLFVFHSDDLLGPYLPHVANPVKTDVRSARPAGRPFRWQGRLFRPAQDGSSTYGGAIVINEVTELSETRFEEHEVARVSPQADGPYPDGLHTLSVHGDRIVVDGKRKITNSAAMRREFIARLKKVRPAGRGQPQRQAEPGSSDH
jgi:hypothetical protein